MCCLPFDKKVLFLLLFGVCCLLLSVLCVLHVVCNGSSGVVCRWLFAVCCSLVDGRCLSVVCYLLCVACFFDRWPFAVCYSLSFVVLCVSWALCVVCCLLFVVAVVCCLFVACRLLYYDDCCLVFVVFCLLCVMCCMCCVMRVLLWFAVGCCSLLAFFWGGEGAWCLLYVMLLHDTVACCLLADVVACCCSLVVDCRLLLFVDCSCLSFNPSSGLFVVGCWRCLLLWLLVVCGLLFAV